MNTLYSLNDYQRLAARTMNNSILERDGQLVMLAMGLLGESVELYEELRDLDNLEGVVGEMGDMLWYVANMCTLLDVPMQDLITEPPYVFTGEDIDENDVFVRATGRVSEIIKKAVFHRHDLGDEAVAEIVDYLSAVMAGCERHISHVWVTYFGNGNHGVHLEMHLLAVCQGNIAKLKERYPDKFSVERSAARE